MPTLEKDPELAALLAAPHSFVPLEWARDRLCRELFPPEPAAWQDRLEQCARDKQPPPEEVEAAYFEAAYALWQAIRTNSFRVYGLDPATQDYFPSNHSCFRQRAVSIATEARAKGAHAVADWHDARRPFDLNFYRQLRDEERRLGRPVEGPMLYIAPLYVNAGELYRWIVPQLALAAEKRHVAQAVRQPDTLVKAADCGAAPHSDQPPKASEAKKYIYDRVRQLLRTDPNLTREQTIIQLKKYGILLRGEKTLQWNCPRGGGLQEVRRSSFSRQFRNLKKEFAEERK